MDENNTKPIYTYDGLGHNASIWLNSNSVTAWDGTIVSGTTTGYGNTVTSAGVLDTPYNLLPAQTNVGTHTIYFKITGGSWWNDFANYTTVTINKVDNPMTIEATQSVARNYSTSAGTVSITAPTNSKGTVSYSLVSTTLTNATVNSSTGAITVPASSAAGTYTIVVKASDSGGTNYLSKDVNTTITLTINKINGSGSVTMAGWTYGGTASSPVPTSSTNGTSNVTYEYNGGLIL